MNIILNASIGPDGNPNGIIDAPKSALFYKSGSFYSINYSGSDSPNWDRVYFQSFRNSKYYLTDRDIGLTDAATGSFLYLKTTNSKNLNGWLLLGNKQPFIKALPTATPTQTLTPSLTPTLTYTITPTITVSRTPTQTPSLTATPTPTVSRTPRPTRTATPTATPTLTLTITPTLTSTPTSTITPTRTITPAITPTLTSTPTLTPTPVYYVALARAPGGVFNFP